MGFNGWGETRVGEDCIKAKDIIVGGEVHLEVVCKGGGDDQGCNGELRRGGSGGRSRIGVSKRGGEFNGHGGDKGFISGGMRGGF